MCPKCDHHMRIGARQRLEFFLDEGDIEEIGAGLEPLDPLKFKDSKRYRDRLIQAQKKTGEKDALVAASGSLFGQPIVACAFEFAFMGGSMGSVVGETFSASRQAMRGNEGTIDLFLCQWRCAHAGSAIFASADGENSSCYCRTR